MWDSKSFAISMPCNDTTTCNIQQRFTSKLENAVYTSHMFDVSLQVLQPKGTHHKPEFKRTEASAEGDLPVLYNGTMLLLDKMSNTDAAGMI